MQELLLDILQAFKNCEEANKFGFSRNEINLRCKMCGDSESNKNRKRLYIGLSDKVLVYYCHNCGAKGLVDEKLLKLYEIDPILIKEYIPLINISIKSNKHKVENKNSYYIFKNKVSGYIPKSSITKDYLETRMRQNITNELLRKYKIILDIEEFLKFNKIPFNNLNHIINNDYSMRIIKESIGFLLYDNNTIQTRSVLTQTSLLRRFSNIHIDLSNPNKGKFYIIPNQLNVMSQKPKIVISEGIFDIISINERIRTQDSESIFVSALGKNAIKNTIGSIQRMLGFIDSEIHLYIDSDVTEEEIKLSIMNQRGLNNIFVYKNKNKKDFGEFEDEYEINVTKY